MPLHIDTDDTAETDLDDLIAWLKAEKIDTSDETDLIRAAPMLRQLSNNQTFLSDIALEELKRGYDGPTTVYHYSAQVMLLHLPKSGDDNFFIRANFWPSLNDQLVKAAGTGPFFYNRPHDHNFNFLTAGYHGPGYWSRYYEYDRTQTKGFPGEEVPSLRFVEKRALTQHHVMLYRASVDVHDQLPSDSMSISLNIVENTARARAKDQYSFDLEKRMIRQIINISVAPCLFGIVSRLGDENGRDVLEEISSRSPDPFMRFSAHKAIASKKSDPEDYCHTLGRALSDPSPMVSGWARNHIETIRQAKI